jgi:hypothetical protein
MRKITAFLVSSILFLAFVSCKKKDAEPDWEGIKITSKNGDKFYLKTHSFSLTSGQYRMIYGDNNTYEKLSMSFFYDKPLPEYKYMTMTLISDVGGFTSGDYSGEFEKFGKKIVSELELGDGTVNDKNQITMFKAGLAQGFNISKMDIHGSEKNITGKIDKLAFENYLPQLKDDDIFNVEIKIKY